MPLGRPSHRWVDSNNTDIADRIEWYELGLVWLRIGTGGPTSGAHLHRVCKYVNIVTSRM
jgi:hypothetical protein